MFKVIDAVLCYDEVPLLQPVVLIELINLQAHHHYLFVLYNIGMVENDVIKILMSLSLDLQLIKYCLKSEFVVSTLS